MASNPAILARIFRVGFAGNMCIFFKPLDQFWRQYHAQTHSESPIFSGYPPMFPINHLNSWVYHGFIMGLSWFIMGLSWCITHMSYRSTGERDAKFCSARRSSWKPCGRTGARRCVFFVDVDEWINVIKRTLIFTYCNTHACYIYTYIYNMYTYYFILHTHIYIYVY